MSIFGQVQPSSFVRARASSGLMNEDPATWTGDWRNCPEGGYLSGDQQRSLTQALEANQRMIVGMALRRNTIVGISAAMGVSRESIARRLRPMGLNRFADKCGGRRLVANAVNT